MEQKRMYGRTITLKRLCNMMVPLSEVVQMEGKERIVPFRSTAENGLTGSVRKKASKFLVSVATRRSTF